MPRLSATSRTLLLHILAWLGFVVYEQSVLLFTDAPQLDVLATFLNYALNAALFYTNSHLLLPRLYARHRPLPYVVAALGLLASYALLRSELYLHLMPVLHAAPAPGQPYERFWILSLYRGTFFQLVSTGYWFARSTIALEKQKLVHEQQLRTTEHSLMQANLAFLKSQINPHFLFNSLNFLYAQVYPHSENAAKAILLLSATMRYALHEDINGKVMLAQEVEHLHNYIALNQLRFHQQLQIQFETSGSTQFLLILPLILITFVENCFKHGELADPAHPVRIRLHVAQNRLTFETHNKKRQGPKEKSTGIGLANIEQRLALIYGGRYRLQITNEADYYTCSLLLDL
jgi:sensor histidine kinase YesM